MHILRRVTGQLLTQLEGIHAFDMSHLDIKMENIMVTNKQYELELYQEA